MFLCPEGPATKIHMLINVTGYVFHADSVAAYLALTVLFAHMALATMYIVYLLYTRVCYSTYSSFVDLFALAVAGSSESDATGTPAAGTEVFQNASSGIKKYRTMRTPVRVRARTTLNGSKVLHRNDVRLFFGNEEQTEGYERLEIGKVYG